MASPAPRASHNCMWVSAACIGDAACTHPYTNWLPLWPAPSCLLAILEPLQILLPACELAGRCQGVREVPTEQGPLCCDAVNAQAKLQQLLLAQDAGYAATQAASTLCGPPDTQVSPCLATNPRNDPVRFDAMLPGLVDPSGKYTSLWQHRSRTYVIVINIAALL